MLGVLLSGLMSQDTYQQLKDTINEANQEGALGAVMPTLTLFAGVVTSQLGGSTGGVASSQQVVGTLIGLYMANNNLAGSWRDCWQTSKDSRWPL